MVTSRNQRAPGDLERVRSLLNSWRIPNDTRAPVDRFAQVARAWRAMSPRQAARLRALRDELRAVVERAAPLASLEPWIARLSIRPTLTSAARPASLGHAGEPAGDILATVLTAIWDGTWPRLKACPDCRWVFYDHSRNATKRWCLMTAGGPSGRACGTIDKVRRFRARQRARTHA